MRSDPIATVLFWAMFVAGGAPLAACLLLPAWFEYDASRQQLLEAEQVIGRAERRIAAISREIEHLKHDDAYQARLLKRESRIDDGSETIAVLDPQQAPPALDPPSAALADETVLKDLSAFVDRTVSSYPLAYVFISQHTRPAVLFMSWAVLLSALALLCRWTPPPEPDGA